MRCYEISNSTGSSSSVNYKAEQTLTPTIRTRPQSTWTGRQNADEIHNSIHISEAPDVTNNGVSSTPKEPKGASNCNRVTLSSESCNYNGMCVPLIAEHGDHTQSSVSGVGTMCVMNECSNTSPYISRSKAEVKKRTKVTRAADNVRLCNNSETTTGNSCYRSLFYFGALSSVQFGRHFRSPSWGSLVVWLWLLAAVFLHQMAYNPAYQYKDLDVYIVPSQASGYLKVQFIRYENPTHHLANGYCCDEDRTECISSMECDHVFDVCFSDPSVKTKCTLGSQLLKGPTQKSVFAFPGIPFTDYMMKEFTKWPGSSEIKITVNEVDGDDASKTALVDTFTYTYTNNKLTHTTAAPGAELELTGSRANSKTKLKIKVWAYCAPKSFGDLCDRSCVAYDSCQLGHYTCDSGGNKACNTGWKGTDCKTRVPELSKCSDYKGLPESVWSSTFTCAGSPQTLTLNVTSVANLKFSGRVDVKKGSETGTYKFTGDQTKHDAITVKEDGWVASNPKVQSFEFTVALSTDGTSLKGAVTSSACAVNDVTFQRISVRAPGCKWATECWKTGEAYNQFSCCCKPDFSGYRCDIPPDRCKPDPCKNGGQCSNLADYSDYKCDCKQGFFTNDCSKTPKDISCSNPNPCQHKGTCSFDSTTGSSCKCTDRYDGHYCENERPCPLHYYGTDCKTYCKKTESCAQGYYSCDAVGKKVCHNGWKGTDCKTRAVEAAVCSNYTGIPESVWNTSFTCAGHVYNLTLNITSVTNMRFSGTVLAKTGSISGTYKLDGDQTKSDIIIKDNGWVKAAPANVHSFQFSVTLSKDNQTFVGTAASPACPVNEVTLKRITVRPVGCEWGDRCWRYGQTYDQFSCCCNPGFTGQRCEVTPDRCSAKPCQNKGNCSTLADYSDFKCNCTKGFYDKTCSKTSKDIPCDPDPCKEGGVCFWNSTRGSKCRCKGFFEGNYCEYSSTKSVPPCDTHRYGPDCEVYCKNTDSCDGHYQCSAKGEKKCFPGWIGATCGQHKTFDDAVRTTHCPDGKTCQNNGVCFKKACCCAPGYNGTLCETEINECDAKPCKNGASCVDKLASYKCTCVKGYKGTNCESIVDYCENKPCKNEGVCELLTPPGTGYRCRCKGRFFTNDCSKTPKDISCSNPNPCQHKGTCSFDSTTGSSCKCTDRYDGHYCENERPCPLHYYGTDCKTYCKKTESCAQGYYSCDAVGKKVCHNGWKGTDCKTRAVEAAVCSNYTGIPESVWNTSFTCAGHVYNLTLNITSVTNMRFSGTVLAKTGSISGTYKLDGGQTKSDIIIKDNGWVKAAPANVHSFQFSVTLSKDNQTLVGTAASPACPVNDVTLKRITVRPVGCEWGDRCWRYGQTYDQFSCCCNPGFTGQRCEVTPDRCSAKPCQNKGNCSTDYSDFKCNCTKGFYDKTCSKTSKDIPCDPDPCKEGGVCFWNSTRGSKCRCKGFFEGNYCEYSSTKSVPPCDTHRYGPDCEVYCKNTNSCDGHYQCSAKGEKKCFPGWIGATCGQHKTFNDAVRTTHCPDGKTCQNNGVCFKKACCCAPGYNGTLCETEINECDAKPCKNGASCVDKLASYKCTCVKGYKGTNCESIVDYCENKPCKNEGVCELLTPPGTGYRCRCKGRFFGTDCDVPSKSKQCNPCKNNAPCSYNTTYGFHCICPKGAVGQRCETTAPGPPLTFDKVNRTDASLNFAWTTPDFTYGHAQSYEVTCTPSKSYNPLVTNDRAKYTKTKILSWQNKTYMMIGLEPGTTYNCSLRARTLAGNGTFNNRTFTTKPGKPVLSSKPVVETSKTTSTTMEITIPQLTVTTGPISAYRIVVQMISAGRLKKRSITTNTNSDNVLHMQKRDTSFNDVLHRERRAAYSELNPEQIKTLTDYATAKNKNLTHYVAAEYTYPYTTFTVGDKKTYGKFFNAALKEGVKYHIYFGVISNLDGESAVVYISLGAPVIAEAIGSINWRVGLGVGIALLVLAFIFIIIIIFVHKDKKDDDSVDSEIDPSESRKRQAKLGATPAYEERNGHKFSEGQEGVPNPAFDHGHQNVHSPVGHASDAYTLQKRLSSEERRLSESYEINYNHGMSKFGKFDNKGFTRE